MPVVVSQTLNSIDEINQFNIPINFDSVSYAYGRPNELLIGPNPIDENGMLHLIFELESFQDVNISIYNNLGQLVFKNNQSLNKGFYGPNYTDVNVDLNMIGLNTGQYFINAKFNGQTFSKTFFVQ